MVSSAAEDAADKIQPNESGSSGTQQPGGKTLEGELLTSPLSSPDFSNTLNGLIAQNPRLFGGIAATELLHSIVRRLETDNQTLTKKIDTLQDDKNEARESLISARTELRNERASKNIRTICASFGVFLITQLINIYKYSNGLGIAIGIIGIGLLIIGFSSSFKKGEK
jgi:outer membrane murein-binding lipoprotein Lpp